MIKEYIQFAIQNGFIFRIYGGKMVAELGDEKINEAGYFRINDDILNIKEIITRKEFIEAVARGIIKDVKKESIDGSSPKFYVYDKFELVKDKIENMERGMVREITTRQAIAIRDGTISEFIKNILPKEEKGNNQDIKPT